jgi:hypothetical protein
MARSWASRLRRGRTRQNRVQRVDRQQVAERPEPANLPDTDRRNHRVPPKLFAGIDIGQVNLHGGDLQGGNRIA